VPATTPTCRICGGSVRELFSGTVLGRHAVRYFECAACGLVQTEAPTWLAEAYAEPINPTDTGIMRRNLVLARITAAVINVFFDRRAHFLDFAGGYGIFVRLMRDRGFDFFWDDPHAPNLMARSFEGAQLAGERVELITSFESFEHFTDPVAELDRMLARGDSILLSTLLAPEPAPALDAWWYYGTEHGQHISFYRARTLRHLATQRGLHVCSNGRNLHLLSRRRIANWQFNACVASGYVGLSELLRPLARSRTLADASKLGAKK
jgi:hypothetical protein